MFLAEKFQEPNYEVLRARISRKHMRFWLAWFALQADELKKETESESDEMKDPDQWMEFIGREFG